MIRAMSRNVMCIQLIHVGHVVFRKGLLNLIRSFGVFICKSVFVTVNISLYISDYHIVFNHMYVCHSSMLGHGYFANPDYLVVEAWIRPTVLFPSLLI